MTGRLNGQVALVIGAARGIGEGIAQRFVEEGARVVIADTEVEAGKETAARLKGLFVETDISRMDHAQRVCPRSIDSCGACDNNRCWLDHQSSIFQRCDFHWNSYCFCVGCRWKYFRDGSFH